MVRRLGAVGTLVWDTNRHPSVVAATGAPLEQWGGAVYSLAALSAARPAGWVVEPIVKVGSDLAERAMEQLRALPGLALGPGVRVVPEPNNRVELRYHDAADRSEHLTGGVPPWEWAELEPLVRGMDALYLNYLSGYELGLDATRRLRDACRGLLYADLHSLFLGPPEGGARAPRALPRAREWVACFDVVQLNEAELALLAQGESPDATLEELLSLGVRVAVVTLGARGVRYAARADLPADPLDWPALPPYTGAARSAVVPPPLGALPGDPTGCGDVWGAAFLAALLAGEALEPAIEQGQRLAAAKMAHPDTATLRHHLAAARLGC